MDAISVAIIDREGFYIDAVLSVLEQQPDITVHGCATIFEDFLNEICDSEIVVLQQETIPLTRELIEKIACRAPEVRLIVLGAPDDENVLVRYIESGASGYVRESEEIDHLLQVIRVVHHGEALAHPELIAPLYQRMAELGRMVREVFPQAPEDIQLTPRQREVIELLVQGRTNQEIADDLDISIGTVKNHVHKIFSHLGVASREQAAAFYSRSIERA